MTTEILPKSDTDGACTVSNDSRKRGVVHEPRYLAPDVKPDPAAWYYAGWLVKADGWENTQNRRSIPVFRCASISCCALVEGHPTLLLQHESTHREELS